MNKEKLLEYLHSKYEESEKEFNQQGTNPIVAMIHQGEMCAYNNVINLLNETED